MNQYWPVTAPFEVQAVERVGPPYQGQFVQAVGGHQAESRASETSFHGWFPAQPTQSTSQGTVIYPPLTAETLASLI